MIKLIPFKFLLLFSMVFTALFADEDNPSFSKGAPFEWVKPCETPLDPEVISSSEENAHWLLKDRQKNYEEQTAYYHFAVQLMTPQGRAIA